MKTNQTNQYQLQHQAKDLQCRMYNTQGWQKWSESNSDKKYISKKGQLCVISASILVASEAFYQHRISLTVCNHLQLDNNDDG